MTQSKDRTDARRYARQTAADIIQHAFVRGELYARVLERMTGVDADEPGFSPLKRIVAQECDAEVRALLVRAAPAKEVQP
jgi:hypothetical protein